MCRRRCQYNLVRRNSDEWSHVCNYAITPSHVAETKTRTGTLVEMYGLPSTHPLIKEMLKPENCPFFEERGQKTWSTI